MAYHAFGIAGWDWFRWCWRRYSGMRSRRFWAFEEEEAIGTTFGVWTGLTIPYGAVCHGQFFGRVLYTVSATGWAVMLTIGAWLLYLPDVAAVLSVRDPGRTGWRRGR